MPGPMRALLAAIAWALPMAAQAHVPWLAALGDPAQGEAAEMALVQMGEPAAPLLLDVLRENGDSTPLHRVRQQAALRVLSLLAADAAAVAGDLAVASIDPSLRVEWFLARGSIEPWGPSAWQDSFHRLFHELAPAQKGPAIAAFVRCSERSSVHGNTVEELLAQLADDEVFAREAVADRLGRLGDRRALVPLAARLRDRTRPPKKHDQVRHNGFVVPIEDQFRLRAAEAMLRIDAADPGNAIAWGCRAALHPHRTVRLQALRSLAQLAPMIDDALPELLAIGRGGDSELAVEALKLVGMTAGGGKEHALELQELERSPLAPVAGRARALLARLRATGTLPSMPPAPVTVAPELVVAVAALGTPADADAGAVVAAAGPAALPLLRDRLRNESAATPESVLRWIGHCGRTLPERERTELRLAISCRTGEFWFAESMSSQTEGQPTALDRAVDAELALGPVAGAGELAAALAHANPHVRLLAAQRLADLPGPLPADVGAALRAATQADHPDKWQQDLTGWMRSWQETADLDGPIRAAAAAALLPAATEGAVIASLWPVLMASQDVPRLATALRRVRSPLAVPFLETAQTDARAEIAAAARQALQAIQGR